MKQLNKKEIKKFFKKTKQNREIYILLENIQYARNVASIFRTADAAGVRRVYLTGITTTPPFGKELRNASRSKEESVEWKYVKDTSDAISSIKKAGFKIVAIELTDNALEISELKKKLSKEEKICFVFGSEVYGVTKSTLSSSDFASYIPMYGKGGSLNVSTTVGITLYAL